MENIAVVLVVTFALAAVAYFLGRSLPRPQQTRRTVIAAISAAIAASAAVIGVGVLPNDDDTAVVDKAIAEARALPLVGLVLDDVPDAEPRLRASMQEEMRHPTTAGAPRPLLLMAKLRTEHIVPALRATDATNAQAVLAARVALMRHLQGVDRAACRELVLIGLQRTDRLDATAQNLMRNMLAAMEAAYRAGRVALKAGGATSPISSDTEAGALLAEAGLTAVDFEKLRTLARLSEAEACDLGIRLNEAPGKLPPDKTGPLARYLAAAR